MNRIEEIMKPTVAFQMAYILDASGGKIIQNKYIRRRALATPPTNANR